MFSQLIFVRLKAAENALRDGRFDEAFRLASAPDLRSHRRAGVVLESLAKLFLERARAHFQADRFREALLDLDRAGDGEGARETVAELRAIITSVAAEHYRRNQARRDRLQDAARRVEAGSLAAGRKILEQASGRDLDALELRHIIEKRAEDAMISVEQAERLLAQAQFADAANRIRRAKAVDAHHEAVARIEAKLCERVLSEAKNSLVAGRVLRSAEELATLSDLGASSADKKELREALALAQDAARCVDGGQFGEARRHTLALRRLLPEAGWVAQVAEQLCNVEESLMRINSGPLGDTLRRTERQQVIVPSPRPLLDQTVAVAVRPRPSEITGNGLLLLVDGGGSYLLLRGERVCIGRAAADHQADIPILSDLAERHAELSRMEDDYFLFASKDVEVAGRPTRHQLLQDGDRIVFGRKGKMTFRLPSRQSPSAVLDLSDTTKMPNDVRRVVLFHQHALVGSSSAAHVNCRHAGPTLVLFERNGTLWIRPKSDGHSDPEAKALILGQSIELGGVRLAIEPWRVRRTNIT